MWDEKDPPKPVHTKMGPKCSKCRSDVWDGQRCKCGCLWLWDQKKSAVYAVRGNPVEIVLDASNPPNEITISVRGITATGSRTEAVDKQQDKVIDQTYDIVGDAKIPHLPASDFPKSGVRRLRIKFKGVTPEEVYTLRKKLAWYGTTPNPPVEFEEIATEGNPAIPVVELVKASMFGGTSAIHLRAKDGVIQYRYKDGERWKASKFKTMDEAIRELNSPPGYGYTTREKLELSKAIMNEHDEEDKVIDANFFRTKGSLQELERLMVGGRIDSLSPALLSQWNKYSEEHRTWHSKMTSRHNDRISRKNEVEKITIVDATPISGNPPNPSVATPAPSPLAQPTPSGTPATIENPTTNVRAVGEDASKGENPVQVIDTEKLTPEEKDKFKKACAQFKEFNWCDPEVKKMIRITLPDATHPLIQIGKGSVNYTYLSDKDGKDTHFKHEFGHGVQGYFIRSEDPELPDTIIITGGKMKVEDWLYN